MALRPDAKIVDWETLDDLTIADVFQRSDAGKRVAVDEGRLALAAGFQAYRKNRGSQSHIIVVDRSALVIDESTL
jgi:hypothetical protein